MFKMGFYWFKIGHIYCCEKGFSTSVSIGPLQTDQDATRPSILIDFDTIICLVLCINSYMHFFLNNSK